MRAYEERMNDPRTSRWSSTFKMIRGLGKVCKIVFEHRLIRCGLSNMEKGRTRGSLIQGW